MTKSPDYFFSFHVAENRIASGNLGAIGDDELLAQVDWMEQQLKCHGGILNEYKQEIRKRRDGRANDNPEV